MDRDVAFRVLSKYQKWRKGRGDKPDSQSVTIAIDVILEVYIEQDTVVKSKGWFCVKAELDKAYHCQKQCKGCSVNAPENSVYSL